MEEFFSDCVYVGRGISFTLQLLTGGFFLGITFGTVLAILRHNGICTPFVKGFVSLVRGTPLMLQMSLLYFAVLPLLNIPMEVLSTGILSFGMNSAAYVAEILRGGIESLPKGQFEAAQTLGIPRFYMWRDIILPQVVRNIFPTLINEIIALLKETALISVIGGMDIMRASQMLSAEQFSYFTPLCIAGGYYYILVLLIEKIGRKFERASHHRPAGL
ncbi:MAG: amino acid ABC transporter permease [Holosporales bacterium]|jgi:polar amino acid transport system permease protein|nr:amino acid ABC transporter permease [Holosporales bacterium]